MYLTIIVIGDELLLGQVVDTNSGEIARTLGPQGWDIIETKVVGDNPIAIKKAVSEAMAQSDLVITTGGLGPTKDDITKKILAEYFGCKMRHDDSVLANVKKIFVRRKLSLNEYTLNQAWVPDGCKIIQNDFGTAPGMWFEQTTSKDLPPKVLISLPGVPYEAVGMLYKDIAPLVSAHFHSDMVYGHHTIIVSGIPESALALEIAPWEDSLPDNLHLAYLPNPGYIRLRIDANAPTLAEAQKLADDAAAQLRKLVDKYLVCDGDHPIADVLLNELKSRGMTMGTAESCTGGNIAHQITLIPGSSEAFFGGVVSYDNSVKTGVLGVNPVDLDRDGAVSEAVVRQMAEGACRTLGTDCAVATSGIAGPGGATPGKPVGTVWMAAHTPSGTITRLYHLTGDRQRIITRATTEALLLLLDHLRKS